MDTADAPETGIPHAEDGTGIALENGLPINHRLRAEALVARGDATDPEGIIGDDLIADTADRLALEEKVAKADAKEEDADLARVRKMGLGDLTKEAARLGVAHESDANKPAILDLVIAKITADHATV